MTSIFEISNDVLFCIFEFLPPWDFLSATQTCREIHKVVTNHAAFNKYWKHQCQQQWKQMKHECTNSFSYDCKTTDKNYNFFALFRSMLDFIMKTLLGAYKSPLEVLYNDLRNPLQNSIGSKILENGEEKQILIDMLVKKVYNNSITIDKIDVHLSKTHLLILIIEADNIDLFQIWLCNMTRTYALRSDGNDKNIDDKNLKCFDINTKIDDFPGMIKHRWASGFRNLLSEAANPILPQVIYKNAINIATFILGKKIARDSDNINYNFANIDLSLDLVTTKDTLLTYCAFYKYSKILSLLINHPNMTKKLMNKRDGTDLTPLHCAVTRNYHVSNDKDDVLNIVTMLLNDERTEINSVSKSGKTPLMTAILVYPEIAHIFIENEKCDVNIATITAINATALHSFAMLADNTDAYLKLGGKFLQRKDWNCNIVNKEGKTPLHIAKDRKIDVIVEILTKCAAQSRS